MFIKLFVIKIVANSFLGFSNNSTTKLAPFVSESSLDKSDCESEKKATSVPDIKAELNNNNNNKIMLSVAIKSEAKKMGSRRSGSGSKP